MVWYNAYFFCLAHLVYACFSCPYRCAFYKTSGPKSESFTPEKPEHLFWSAAMTAASAASAAFLSHETVLYRHTVRQRYPSKISITHL
jgi:hypothetical protein